MRRRERLGRVKWMRVLFLDGFLSGPLSPLLVCPPPAAQDVGLRNSNYNVEILILIIELVEIYNESRFPVN